jgi:hypothetical protein
MVDADGSMGEMADSGALSTGVDAEAVDVAAGFTCGLRSVTEGERPISSSTNRMRT